MKSILLVENNPDEQELAQLALEQTGYFHQLMVVSDGIEALDYLFCTGKFSQRQPETMPSLVLLDLKLPKIDGLEVLRRLRADGRTKLLPIVILTTSTEIEDVVKGYRSGCNSYIRKPVDFAEFSDLLKQVWVYWLDLNQSPHKFKIPDD
ncbi:MAG: response regulator [Cyanobacteriota bacterium]|nr:response regulator [Cyanobacteriota bacterium]